MPSTTSRVVSRPFASSTVITPSLPTLSIALLMISPMVESPLAEMVPTWAISFGSLVLLLSFCSSATTASTALSTPRSISIGLLPAAASLAPSRKMAWARTVAVVVPSPATSEVLEATSLTICAPMFSNLFSSSISFATVTPSLVMVGAPNDFSKTTLRPLGPSVTFTASARVLTPLRMASRARTSNRISLAAISFFSVIVRGCYFSMTPRMSSSRIIKCSWPSILISVPAYLENSTRSPGLMSRARTFPSSRILPFPTAMTSPSMGFSLAVSGMMMPPFVFSSSCTRLTITRSCRGRIFIGFPPDGEQILALPWGECQRRAQCNLMRGRVKACGNLPIRRMPVLFSGRRYCLADAPILSSQSMRDFFRDLLSRAIENQRAQVQPFTELYIVNLLHGFLASEALYVEAEDGTLQQKPLAFLLKEALEEAGPARLRLLRRLGDTSLFISGFFPDSLARRSSLVDVDYYIAMGGRAYDAVARHAAERSLWEELADKFRLLVDLLNEVSERTLASTDAGLIRLYERWMKTGSERLAAVLVRQGVVPRRGFVQ